MSDGEQSSTCSQVLDRTTSEPQSTIIVDVTTTNKHKHRAIDHQQISVTASYQPQTSLDTECVQLAIDLDSNPNQKKRSYQPYCNNFSITTPVYFEFPQCKK